MQGDRDEHGTDTSDMPWRGISLKRLNSAVPVAEPDVIGNHPAERDAPDGYGHRHCIRDMRADTTPGTPRGMIPFEGPGDVDPSVHNFVWLFRQSPLTELIITKWMNLATDWLFPRALYRPAPNTV